MKVSEIKELVGSNASLRKNLNDYVNAYIDWVSKDIPSGFENYFGVGISASHRQFGDYWGFYNDALDCYTCTGGSYYAGGDYNAEVVGSSSLQVQRFAKEIPWLIENGLKLLAKENAALAEIVKNQITFS